MTSPSPQLRGEYCYGLPGAPPLPLDDPWHRADIDDDQRVEQLRQESFSTEAEQRYRRAVEQEIVRVFGQEDKGVDGVTYLSSFQHRGKRSTAAGGGDSAAVITAIESDTLHTQHATQPITE